MPAEFVNDVYGSTLNDLVHKGARQAGFKSSLAYRNDIGIPNYTGYNPSSRALIINTKGATERTGKLIDEQTKVENTLASNDTHRISEYAHKYVPKPGDYKVPTKTGGGYWFSQRALTASPPFVQTTIYDADMNHGAETKKEQLDKTMGLSCTVVNYEAARQRRSQSAPRKNPFASQTIPPTTAQTSNGDQVGFTTEYDSMVVKDPLTGGTCAAGAPRRPSTVPEFRYSVMPRAMEPAIDGTTTYHLNHGPDGGDPQDRGITSKFDMTHRSTTRELAEGTSRNTQQLPGYTGFCPASQYNDLARSHAFAAETRKDAKSEMLLYSLDQYSRSRLPHNTTYKPQTARNITSIQPSQGPTTSTTSGFMASQTQKAGIKAKDTSHFLDSNKGLMSFFQGGGESVSDNGLANAQKYYGILKPLEGRPKMQLVSKTTAYGAQFNPQSSLV